MKRLWVIATALAALAGNMVAPAAAEGEGAPGAVLLSGITETDPASGGSIAVDTVDPFAVLGGFVTIDQGTETEEIVFYASVDAATSTLTGIVREEPQTHAAGASVTAVDVCVVPNFCDDIALEVDYWGMIEQVEASSALHADCEASALEPFRDGLFIAGLGDYACEAKQHASTTVKVCIQIKKGGSWHTIHPCSAETRPRTDYVSALAEAGCVEGRHYYRTWAHGFAVNNDGAVVHADTGRSPRRSITCQTAATP